MKTKASSKRGTVFILMLPAPMAGDPGKRVEAHWESHVTDLDGDVGIIEDMSPAADIDEALVWARIRSERVVVQNLDPALELPFGTFWAGSNACPPGVARWRT